MEFTQPEKPKRTLIRRNYLNGRVTKWHTRNYCGWKNRTAPGGTYKAEDHGWYANGPRPDDLCLTCGSALNEIERHYNQDVKMYEQAKEAFAKNAAAEIAELEARVEAQQTEIENLHALVQRLEQEKAEIIETNNKAALGNLNAVSQMRDRVDQLEHTARYYDALVSDLETLLTGNVYEFYAGLGHLARDHRINLDRPVPGVTTITSFDGAHEGQQVSIAVADAHTTIEADLPKLDETAQLKAALKNVTAQRDDVLTFWHLIHDSQLPKAAARAGHEYDETRGLLGNDTEIFAAALDAVDAIAAEVTRRYPFRVKATQQEQPK